MDITLLGRLLGLAPLLLDPPAPRASGSPPVVDQVVLRGAVSAEELRELGGLGMRSLAALVPSLVRALDVGADAAPLGHLARSLGDAAHQLGVGMAVNAERAELAGLAAPWREEAGRHLRDAATVLDRAGVAIAATPGNPQDVAWAALQIAGAQRVVAGTERALAGLATKASGPARFGAAPGAPAWSPPLRAVALAGALALLLLVACVHGLGVAAAVAVAAAGAVTWRWQILLGARPVRLALRGSRNSGR